MQPDVDFFLLGQFLRLALRTHVEADDDGVRSRSQQHIGLGDRAHAGAQNFQPDLVVGQLRQQVAQHFDRSTHVGLEDDVQFLGAGRLQLFRQAFQRHAGTLRQSRLAGFLFAIFGNAAGLVAIGDYDELIARLRQPFHTQNLDWSGRRSFLELCAAIVKHGAHFAVNIADHEVVAGAQGAVLYQHGGHRSASAVELGFQNYAAGRTLRMSP